MLNLTTDLQRRHVLQGYRFLMNTCKHDRHIIDSHSFALYTQIRKEIEYAYLAFRMAHFLHGHLLGCWAKSELARVFIVIGADYPQIPGWVTESGGRGAHLSCIRDVQG